MSEEHKEDADDRGALVLPPEPVARGAFALLVPGNMRWTVSEFAGGFRLDFSARSRSWPGTRSG